MTMYKAGVGYEHLEDLIAGKVPTLTGWTVDPTDGANITDGDITTFCTTGNRVSGAPWQYAYFEWDLGAFYHIMLTGVGSSTTTAGNQRTFATLYDGAAWLISRDHLTGYSANAQPFTCYGGMCSKVRVGITADAAATITPNIREFNVWRL